jgi:hypothetical protein
MVITHFFFVVCMLYRAFTVVNIKPRNMEESEKLVISVQCVSYMYAHILW